MIRPFMLQAVRYLVTRPDLAFCHQGDGPAYGVASGSSSKAEAAVTHQAMKGEAIIEGKWFGTVFLGVLTRVLRGAECTNIAESDDGSFA